MLPKELQQGTKNLTPNEGNGFEELSKKTRDFINYLLQLEEERRDLFSDYDVSTSKGLRKKIKEDVEELTNLKIWLEETTGCKGVGNAKQRVESWAKTFDSQNEFEHPETLNFQLRIKWLTDYKSRSLRVEATYKFRVAVDSLLDRGVGEAEIKSLMTECEDLEDFITTTDKFFFR